MTAKITPDMTVLSETLLIPLWAKAVEQERDERLLTDPEAPRMLAQIDYDFSKFKNIVMSQVGCCGRAQIFDNEARKFIAAHPDAVVVQLGAGLDARFERLGRPQITAWYDLDLPEVIALRRQLLPESTNHYFAISLFDESWMQTVAAHGKPVLLLCEGVLMYFDTDTIKDWLATCRRQRWCLTSCRPSSSARQNGTTPSAKWAKKRRNSNGRSKITANWNNGCRG